MGFHTNSARETRESWPTETMNDRESRHRDTGIPAASDKSQELRPEYRTTPDGMLDGSGETQQREARLRVEDRPG